MSDEYIIDGASSPLSPVGAKLFGADAAGNVGHLALRGVQKNTIAILGNSVALQLFPYSTTATYWAPATAYTVGNKVASRRALVGGGVKSIAYECTAAGTSAGASAIDYSVEPQWPTTIGATIVDGGVTWTAIVDGDIYQRWSWWTIAQALSGYRLKEVYASALSGRRVSDIAQRLPEALAQSPGYVWLGTCLENDIWPGSAPIAADINAAWATYLAMIEAVTKSGAIPIIATPIPSGNIDSTSVFTGYSAGAGTKAFYWLTNKIREFADQNRSRVLFVDLQKLYLDPNNANPVYPENTATYLSASGTGALLKKTDGIHPNMAAAWLIGKEIARVISANVPEINHFPGGAGDIYKADPNPLNYGTSGTDGTGVTGDVPNLLTETAYGTGAAITASVVARGDGVTGNWARMVYTATAGDNAALNYTTAPTLASLGLSVGDKVEFIAEVKIPANPTLLKNVLLECRFSGGSNPQWVRVGYLVSSEQDIGQFIAEETTLTLKTPSIAIPTGTTSINVYVKGVCRGASSFTIDVGRRAVRREAMPVFA